MKRLVLRGCSIMLFMFCMAQEKKFSPEKFDAEMTAYITKQARLTDEEAAKLFPLLREMHKQQRCLYQKKRSYGKEKPATEEGCANAIHNRDKLDIELKQLEQTYHKKMMCVLPASKVYDVIKAESQFHRQMMKGWQKGRRP